MEHLVLLYLSLSHYSLVYLYSHVHHFLLILFYIKDEAGNSSETKTRTIKVVEAEGPQLNLSNMGSSSWTKGQTITATATDNSNIRSFTYQVIKDHHFLLILFYIFLMHLMRYSHFHYYYLLFHFLLPVK